MLNESKKFKIDDVTSPKYFKESNSTERKSKDNIFNNFNFMGRKSFKNSFKKKTDIDQFFSLRSIVYDNQEKNNSLESDSKVERNNRGSKKLKFFNNIRRDSLSPVKIENLKDENISIINTLKINGNLILDKKQKFQTNINSLNNNIIKNEINNNNQKEDNFPIQADQKIILNKKLTVSLNSDLNKEILKKEEINKIILKKDSVINIPKLKLVKEKIQVSPEKNEDGGKPIDERDKSEKRKFMINDEKNDKIIKNQDKSPPFKIINNINNSINKDKNYLKKTKTLKDELENKNSIENSNKNHKNLSELNSVNGNSITTATYSNGKNSSNCNLNQGYFIPCSQFKEKTECLSSRIENKNMSYKNMNISLDENLNGQINPNKDKLNLKISKANLNEFASKILGNNKIEKIQESKIINKNGNISENFKEEGYKKILNNTNENLNQISVNSKINNTYQIIINKEDSNFTYKKKAGKIENVIENSKHFRGNSKLEKFMNKSNEKIEEFLSSDRQTNKTPVNSNITNTLNVNKIKFNYECHQEKEYLKDDKKATKISFYSTSNKIMQNFMNNNHPINLKSNKPINDSKQSNLAGNLSSSLANFYSNAKINTKSNTSFRDTENNSINNSVNKIETNNFEDRRLNNRKIKIMIMNKDVNENSRKKEKQNNSKDTKKTYNDKLENSAKKYLISEGKSKSKKINEKAHIEARDKSKKSSGSKEKGNENKNIFLIDHAIDFKINENTENKEKTNYEILIKDDTDNVLNNNITELECDENKATTVKNKNEDITNLLTKNTNKNQSNLSLFNCKNLVKNGSKISVSVPKDILNKNSEENKYFEKSSSSSQRNKSNVENKNKKKQKINNKKFGFENISKLNIENIEEINLLYVKLTHKNKQIFEKITENQIEYRDQLGKEVKKINSDKETIQNKTIKEKTVDEFKEELDLE